MTPTPRTDAAVKRYFGDNRPSMEDECVLADFARQLERELAELKDAATEYMFRPSVDWSEDRLNAGHKLISLLK